MNIYQSNKPELQEAWNEVVTQALSYAAEEEADAICLQGILSTPQGYTAVSNSTSGKSLAAHLDQYAEGNTKPAVAAVKRYLRKHDDSFVTRVFPFFTKGHLNRLDVYKVENDVNATTD